ncbi:hypothetical protein CAXC1_220067 [Candidatus Xenohaliotis californiensis]|uniref:Uncharacterized protein n=1 Tax=Candidatus Xenohaliotis californiensis TaxID=84677 RepID=A0ABM9N7V3_9RICK|nr:hypothetical protein CAXC1_220067 [Candidatus Xenohaliotis californiensis]
MDNNKSDLSFIKYENLYLICKEIIDILQKANEQIESTIHSNIIDPFSAVFEASF